MSERLGSAQQRNTWSTGEEWAFDALEAWCAWPVATTAAGASMPTTSLAITDRDGGSGA
ncbi:hypothetical protein ABT001_02930 [Streptomyces sp. NPDC002793]|uniref:hypothetical protein n=1 Tax=Streptomyces sp. NPDC002793 TaxID=3154432 RepID=UPI00332FD25C